MISFLPSLRAGASSSILHGDFPVGNAKASRAPSGDRLEMASVPMERATLFMAEMRKESQAYLKALMV